MNNPQLIKLAQQLIADGIRIKDNFWENIIIQGAGAFFGALFAFLFGLLTFWINKKRERFILHKNAVVELEYLLNDHLNYIGKNEFLITNTIGILKQKHYTYNELIFFRLSENLELRLGDLDIINRYFDYKESIIRLNSDFKKVNKAFDNLNNFALVRGQTPDERNFTHLIGQLESISKLLEGVLIDQTKNLLAYVRIYLRKLQSPEEKGLNIYKLNGYKKITNGELKKELKKLNKETEETIRKSKEEIKRGMQ